MIGQQATPELLEAKRLFKVVYAHLYNTKVPGGINGVGIGIDHRDHLKTPLGVRVYVEHSQEVYDMLPDTFMGFAVYKLFASNPVAF